jgi:hypothetical protein
MLGRSVRTAFLAVLISVLGQLTLAPLADATPYTNSSSVYFCKADATDTVMKVPHHYGIPRLRGTSDFKVDGNGFSLRTCYWHARSGSFNYVCPAGSNSGGWTLEIVTRSETHGNESSRVKVDIVCDGRVKGYGYSGFNPAWATHFHVHDPTNCGPRRFFPDPNCPVLGRFDLTIDKPTV